MIIEEAVSVLDWAISELDKGMQGHEPGPWGGGQFWVPTFRDSISNALAEWRKASAVESWGQISDPAYGQGLVILALAQPWEQAYRNRKRD